MSTEAPAREEAPATTWTGKLRDRMKKDLPYDKLLPQAQPSYVASWIYVFGVLTLVSLAFVILTGALLSIEGPSWYHTSSIGYFFNSLHFWSVQLFFLFMVLHLWGKFWMAAWRGRRALTWITGVIALMVSIFAGMTGYVLQSNLDSQWISFEAKDGLNAIGLGAWFNVTNLGQMLLVHAFLLPLVIGLIVVGHVVLVRLRGVVPPIDAAKVAEAKTTSEEGI